MDLVYLKIWKESFFFDVFVHANPWHTYVEIGDALYRKCCYKFHVHRNPLMKIEESSVIFVLFRYLMKALCWIAVNNGRGRSPEAVAFNGFWDSFK